MKTFLELVQNRQSDRAFFDTPVEKEKIERILEAARLAPSACNSQPWKFVVVTNAEKRTLVADATASKVLSMNHFTKQAPVQLVLIEENSNFTSNIGGMLANKHYPHIDLGIAASHISLAATDEGLGSCIVGWCNEKKVRKALDIPRNKRVLLVIFLGYSNQPSRTKTRKTIEEIVSWEKY
ncbi:MAG: nitroreductase family protein [Paludibacter sp.]|jgi:nitroreductase|nr:nitroreductase family protein [Paludibacter sp.]